MAKEESVLVAEIIKRLDELKKNEAVKEYLRLTDALYAKLESATLAWARRSVG